MLKAELWADINPVLGAVDMRIEVLEQGLDGEAKRIASLAP